MAGVSDMRHRQSGYVMQDFLLSLLIVVVMVQITTAAIRLLPSFSSVSQSVQDEIAFAQLQKILIISDDFNVEEETLYFTNQGREMKLRKVNGNVIIQPGTQIILADVDYVVFKDDGCRIYCIWQRDEKSYERIIALY